MKGRSLARNIQVAHSDIASHATPFNRMLTDFWNLHTRLGRAALDAEINRQAAMVAYIDDFKLFLIAMIAAAPLLLLLKTGGQLQRSSEPVAPPVE